MSWWHPQERELSPLLPAEDEDHLLSEAQLDVNLFSSQELEETHSLFSSSPPKKKSSSKRRSLLRSPSFKWRLPGESLPGQEVYGLDKTLEKQYHNMFLTSSKAFHLPSSSHFSPFSHALMA